MKKLIIIFILILLINHCNSQTPFKVDQLQFNDSVKTKIWWLKNHSVYTAVSGLSSTPIFKQVVSSNELGSATKLLLGTQTLSGNPMGQLYLTIDGMLVYGARPLNDSTQPFISLLRIYNYNNNGSIESYNSDFNILQKDTLGKFPRLNFIRYRSFLDADTAFIIFDSSKSLKFSRPINMENISNITPNNGDFWINNDTVFWFLNNSKIKWYPHTTIIGAVPTWDGEAYVPLVPSGGGGSLDTSMTVMKSDRSLIMKPDTLAFDNTIFNLNNWGDGRLDVTIDTLKIIYGVYENKPFNSVWVTTTTDGYSNPLGIYFVKPDHQWVGTLYFPTLSGNRDIALPDKDGYLLVNTDTVDIRNYSDVKYQIKDYIGLRKLDTTGMGTNKIILFDGEKWVISSYTGLTTNNIIDSLNTQNIVNMNNWWGFKKISIDTLLGNNGDQVWVGNGFGLIPISNDSRIGDNQHPFGEIYSNYFNVNEELKLAGYVTNIPKIKFLDIQTPDSVMIRFYSGGALGIYPGKIYLDNTHGSTAPVGALRRDNDTLKLVTTGGNEKIILTNGITELIDSTAVKNGGLSVNDMSPNYRFGISLSNDYIPRAVGDSALENSPFTVSGIIDTFSNIRQYIDMKTANTGVVEGSYTNANITVGADGRILYAESGTNNQATILSGIAYFNGQDQLLKIYDNNINEGDIFAINPSFAYLDTPTTADILGYYSIDDTLMISRPPNGKSNLRISYSRLTLGYGFNPNVKSAQLIFWGAARLENDKLTGDTLNYIKDNSNQLKNAYSFGKYRPLYGEGAITEGAQPAFPLPASAKPYYQFTGRKDSTFVQSDVGKLITGYHPAYTVIIVAQIDTFIYTAGNLNTFYSFEDTLSFLSYYEYGGFRTFGADSLSLRLGQYMKDTTTDLPVTPNADYNMNAALRNTLKNYANIFMYQYDTVNNVGAYDTLRIYFNSLVQLVGNDNSGGDTTIHHTLVLGNGKTFTMDHSPAYPLAGKIYEILVYKGELSNNDKEYIFRKLDAIYNTPYVP